MEVQKNQVQALFSCAVASVLSLHWQTPILIEDNIYIVPLKAP